MSFSVNVAAQGVDFPPRKAAAPSPDKSGHMEQMKSIRKARLARQVFADPSLAAKLPALEASPVYNASGNLIAGVGGSLNVSV